MVSENKRAVKTIVSGSILVSSLTISNSVDASLCKIASRKTNHHYIVYEKHHLKEKMPWHYRPVTTECSLVKSNVVFDEKDNLSSIDRQIILNVISEDLHS